jgi:Sulfotransferase domain
MKHLPRFLIVGPPRTGTSWIHSVLSSRAVLPAVNKETRFFDLHFHRGLSWYLRQFPKCPSPGAPSGEVGPTYFSSPVARENIFKTLPGVKVLCIFRNPVERIVSLYRLKRAYGMIEGDLERALQCDDELLESGKYATHLKAWIRRFGTEQVQVAFYETLKTQPQCFADKMADFAGVPRFLLGPADLRYVHKSEVLTIPRHYHVTRHASEVAEWMKVHGLGKLVSRIRHSRVGHVLLQGGSRFASLEPRVTQGILETLRSEIDELEDMLNVDLSDWKSSDAERFSPLVERTA